MGKNFNNNRMYTVKVEKAGFSGIYKGAGTRDEVRQDIEFLRARGVKHEEMTVLPIIGKPRKEIEKVVINNSEDRQLIASASKASASYAKGVLVGTVLGAGVIAGAYLLYKSSKKEEEKEKEE